MSGFSLADFLSVIGSLSIPDFEKQIESWRATEGAKYPDVSARIDAFAAWITGKLEEAKPGLDVVSLKDTILGVAHDIISGTAGVDPGAGHGAV